MELDIRTLVFVLGITHLIQFGVLIHQHLINRTIRGVGWWLLWSAVEVVAFTCMLLRGIPSIQSTAIIAQNCLLILGVIFFYIGILRFFGQKENRPLLVSLYAAFAGGLCYFLFVHDSINTRGAIISVTLAALAFLSGWALLANKTRSTAASANFLAAVCIAHGLHFTFRGVVQLAGIPTESFFAPTLFNWTAFMDAIVVGILWTFATILMINQHLNAEMQEAKEEMELVFNTSPDAVLITRLSDGVIANVNHGFLVLSGFRREECIGKSTLGVNIWKKAADREFIVKELREKGRCQSHEAILQRKDGSELAGLMSAVAFDLKGTPHVISVTRDITERKRAQAELENLHKQLLDTSRQAGMAEIATNVLHNVGNVLNSVNISTGLIVESVKKSRASSLARVVGLLQEHAPDLGEFITHDSRGKHVPAHLAQLAVHLQAEQETNVRELELLRRNVDHIKEIVAMQQNYATFGGVKEMINIVSLVEDSLRLNEGALSRHRVEVIRELEPVPPLNLEKHKFLQIMVNLLRNAKHACQDSERADKQLTVRVANGEGRIKISVIDNGVGIPPENLTRIFNHGFTTRKGGHGFGLHSGALAAKEMGGSLTFHSDGPGQGATFTLELPCPTRENSHE